MLSCDTFGKRSPVWMHCQKWMNAICNWLALSCNICVCSDEQENSTILHNYPLTCIIYTIKCILYTLFLFFCSLVNKTHLRINIFFEYWYFRYSHQCRYIDTSRYLFKIACKATLYCKLVFIIIIFWDIGVKINTILMCCLSYNHCTSLAIYL